MTFEHKAIQSEISSFIQEAAREFNKLVDPNARLTLLANNIDRMKSKVVSFAKETKRLSSALAERKTENKQYKELIRRIALEIDKVYALVMKVENDLNVQRQAILKALEEMEKFLLELY